MKRLLIVDDDERILRALGRQIRREFEDWAVLQCHQSAIAMYIASRQTYRAGDRDRTNYNPPKVDVVISDFQMPGYNGLEVLSAFAEHSPMAIRILSSGLDFCDIAKVDSRTDTVVDFYLAKPLDIETLHRILDSMEE